jgi:hypothetical protein
MRRKKTQVERANYHYYKPHIDLHHNKVYRWLIVEAGYTVKYLSIILQIDLNKVNPLFIHTERLSVAQVLIIVKLLKGVRSASEVLESLFFEKFETAVKVPVGTYDIIQLPETSIQAIRTDFEPPVIRKKS